MFNFSNIPQDEQFVVQYCLTASWPTLSIAEEMLSYTLNRFPCCQIQTALAKLATFASMYGPNNFEYVHHASDYTNPLTFFSVIEMFDMASVQPKLLALWILFTSCPAHPSG